MNASEKWRTWPGIDWPFFLIFSGFLAGLFLAGEGVASEEPRFEVLKSADSFEVRRYESLVVAETVVDGDFEAARDEGFRRLFFYLAGHNRVRPSGSPAASDGTGGDSLMIPLGAPIFQARAGGKYRLYLPLPTGFTLQTLPEPLDPRVSLKTIPERTLAAAGYTGTWEREKVWELETALLDWMRRQGLNPSGEPLYAGYDSSDLWFLSRQEVLIPLQEEWGSPVRP